MIKFEKNMVGFANEKLLNIFQTAVCAGAIVLSIGILGISVNERWLPYDLVSEALEKSNGTIEAN